jgi:hypothetical protein
MIAEIPPTEILRRIGWTTLLLTSWFFAASKFTTVVVLVPFFVLWIRRLLGRGGLALPIVFALFVATVVIPIDIAPENRPGLPRLIPVVHGMVGPEARARAERGEIVLTGCIVHPFAARWILFW